MQVHEDHIELRSLLNGNKSSEFNSAITFFDWAVFDVRRVAISSVDTKCIVWDTERETVDTQLVAHDKEVYDISWGGFNVFASVSGDGSVRVFDLRDKEWSTIIYETGVPDSPLLHLEWNKGDPRFIATVGTNNNKVVVLDIRFPTAPLVELAKHKGSVSAVTWASMGLITFGEEEEEEENFVDVDCPNSERRRRRMRQRKEESVRGEREKRKGREREGRRRDGGHVIKFCLGGSPCGSGTVRAGREEFGQLPADLSDVIGLRFDSI